MNPELGTMDDFKHLVEGIRTRGMRVMLDIVYNHTSPDSWLAKNHPEYFYKTPEGRWETGGGLGRYCRPGLWE